MRTQGRRDPSDMTLDLCRGQDPDAWRVLEDALLEQGAMKAADLAHLITLFLSNDFYRRHSSVSVEIERAIRGFFQSALSPIVAASRWNTKDLAKVNHARKRAAAEAIDKLFPTLIGDAFGHQQPAARLENLARLASNLNEAGFSKYLIDRTHTQIANCSNRQLVEYACEALIVEARRETGR